MVDELFEKESTKNDAHVSAKEVAEYYASRVEFLNSKDVEAQHDLPQ